MATINKRSNRDYVRHLETIEKLLEEGGGGGGTPNAVKYTAQSLTSSQQQQARTNIGSASASELSQKQDTLVSGTNIKTLNNQSLLGSGNITIDDQSAVKYTEAQSLSNAQKATARGNIAAASLADINNTQYVKAAIRPEPSENTVGPIYLIGPDANDEYERYFTQESNGTYTWVALGSTEIHMDGYATDQDIEDVNDEISHLEAKVDDISGTLWRKITAIGTLIVSALKKAVFNSDDVEDIITDIEEELTDDIISINATYTQSEDVYVGQSLDDLKNDLVVTANYTDGTSVEITAYTLSGTLTAGTSTIVVSYGGKETSFNVSVLPALYYRKDKFYYKGALTATSISSQLSHITVDGVTYVYTQQGSSVLNQRACYFYFDLALTPGTTYNYKFYYSGLPSGVTLKLAILGAKQSFWDDGVANTYHDHANDLLDSGWLFPTVSDGIISQNLKNPSLSVGVRLLFMAIDSGGNGVEWPSSLKIDRFVINPA